MFTKGAKAAAGIVALFVLIAVVNTWWGDYRSKTSDDNGSVTATSTVEPGKEDTKAPSGDNKNSTQPKAKVIVVLTDGLNFRERPSQGSNAIRGLDKGEKVTLIKKEGDWYNVKDSKGTVGWISASPTYSRVQ